jgi:predicted methyltransferase
MQKFLILKELKEGLNMNKYTPKQINEQFNLYLDQRPATDRNLDQFWATTETVINRAEFISNIPNIEDKKILFLGDDDLTSIAFCQLYNAKNITVIDIDKRLIKFINKIAKEKKLPIQTIEYDLRYKLPQNVSQDFDIIFFDPPYTPTGINTWLNRAIESSLGGLTSKREKNPTELAKKTYLMCYGYTNRSTERGLKVQQIVTSLGIVIQDKIRLFNKYYEAKTLNSSSDLYILQPTPMVTTKKLDIAQGVFYTGQRINKKN